MANLDEILNRIEVACRPTSIFLYGSQARSDTVVESDYEIGVLVPTERYVGRAVLSDAVNTCNVSVFPFKLEEFVSGNPDTPFNKNIYIYELIKSARTVRGERVLERMILPDISIIDFISEAEFNLGYALASVIANRNEAITIAAMLFSKSCLFGTRSLIAARTGKFVTDYADIVEESKALDLGKYHTLVDAAFETRLKGTYHDEMLFLNISYLNQLVVPSLRVRISLADSGSVLFENPPV